MEGFHNLKDLETGEEVFEEAVDPQKHFVEEDSDGNSDNLSVVEELENISENNAIEREATRITNGQKSEFVASSKISEEKGMKPKISDSSNNNNINDVCDHHRFKKVVLLTSLENGLSKASISESMLRTLEALEEIILHCDTSPIIASMRSAYCSIAVECTLKYLEVENIHPSYLKAVYRIWQIRFHDLEKNSLLFSDELKIWRTLFIISLSNPIIIDSFCTIFNTRKDAFNMLKLFLSKARASFGVCSHDSAAALEQHQHIAPPVETRKVKQLQKGESTVRNQNVSPGESVESPTSEWDSMHSLLGGIGRFHLPSPKRWKISPLKKFKVEKLTVRRKYKKWSQLEEQTLRTAVNDIGIGNWKLILDCYKSVFEERTVVDLKDKWRNMERKKESKR